MADNPTKIKVLNTKGEISGLVETHGKAANIFAYLMHQEFVQQEQKSTFLKIVRDEDLPMVNMSKEFALHLISNLEAEKRKLLAQIQEQDQNDYGFANEALVDFVEMELWDPTVTYRKWEYGRYAINHFIKNFDDNELPSKSKTTDGDQKSLLENFASSINQSPENWEDQVRLFLIQAIRYHLNPAATTVAVYELVADVVMKNLIYLSIKMDALRLSFKESLTQAIDKGWDRAKGPKR